jgi:hypothetical protein
MNTFEPAPKAMTRTPTSNKRRTQQNESKRRKTYM